MSYQIIADLHTHTLASTHAYSTVSEMVLAARAKGLYAIAITDHARTMPGAPREWYFSSLRELPLYHHGVMTLAGIEANVLDLNGTLDLEENDAPKMDWVVASIHNLGLPGLENPDVEKCTNLWMNVAKNPYVRVIGHSGDPAFAYNYDRVIPEFGRNGKLVEINSHTFDVRKRNIENCRKIALACKKHGVPLVVDSDAHFETQVGNFAHALELLEEIGFPEELIVNSSRERLDAYLEQYTNIHQNRPY